MFSSLTHVRVFFSSQADRLKVTLRLKLAEKGNFSEFECGCLLQTGWSEPPIAQSDFLRFKNTQVSDNDSTETNRENLLVVQNVEARLARGRRKATITASF